MQAACLRLMGEKLLVAPTMEGMLFRQRSKTSLRRTVVGTPQLRTTFKQVLAEGYTVTGFEMGANQGTYLLERHED
jgi:hypothetical protein